MKNNFFSRCFFILFISFFVLMVSAVTVHADTTAPVISSVVAINIMGSGAQITWITDDPSNSRVPYGTSPDVNTFFGFSDSRCDGGGNVTNHCVNLTGLSANTTYYYKVESMNEAGLDTHSFGYQFTSASDGSNSGSSGGGESSSSGSSTSGGSGGSSSVTLPSVPSGLSASLDSSGGSVFLQWTDTSVNDEGFKIERRLLGGTFMTRDYVSASVTSYTDSGPGAGTYEYAVRSCNSDGCSTQSNIVSIAVALVSTSSSIPSAPSNLTAVLRSNGTSVDLSWTDNSTNESEFKIFRTSGTGGSWALLSTKGTNTTSHTDSSSLTSGATYTYYVIACTSSGCSGTSNTPVVTLSGGTSGGSTSTTTANTTTTTTTTISDTTAPVVSGVAAINIMGSGAQIVWNTDDSSDSRVTFGTNPDTNTFSAFSDYRCDSGGNVTSHCVNITGLSANTVYNYKVESMNVAGLDAHSGGYQFTSASGGFATTTTTYSTTTTTYSTTSITLTSPVFSASVSGRITDDKDTPLRGAKAHIARKDNSAYYDALVNENGDYKSYIPSGEYIIEAFPGTGSESLVRPAPVAFSVQSGETRSVNFTFKKAVKRISGSVLFSNGTPVTDAEVGAYSKETGQWQSALVAADGSYALVVGSGTWQVGTRPREGSGGAWAYSGEFPTVAFSTDTSSETKTVNFMIPAADATLSASVVDASGAPLVGVGVVVDTLSAGDTSATHRDPLFKQSGFDGNVSFSLRSGTYYIRAYLPTDKGFVNPPEVQLVVGSGEKKNVRLMFKQRDALTASILTGTTKLDDGKPVDAFVWAWSEKGGALEARADANGLFSMQLASLARWHIGAGKKFDEYGYRSDELVLDVGSEHLTTTLVLHKVSEEKLASSVTTSQDATAQVVTQTTDGARVIIAGGSSGASGTITIEITPTVEAPSQAGAKVVGRAYDVSVRDSGGVQLKTFSDEIEVTIPYTDVELKALGITENAIVPSYFDNTTGSWVAVDNFTVDKEKNIAIARVKHLTRFAIVAAADITPPAPPVAVKVSATVGGVLLSWINPTTDFSHVKIYRSLTVGALSAILATDIKQTSYYDTTAQDGVRYYYTVRAVDPAGNETANTDQVSAFGVALAIADSTLKSSQTPQTSAIFTRDLTIGVEGDDVRELQKFLNAHGFQVAVSGDGSPLNETTYFGKRTAAAVARFQESYATEILVPAGRAKGSGYVGPATRKKLNALYGGSSSEKPATGAAEPPLIPPGLARKIELSRNLKVGESGGDVKALQEFLLAQGLYPEGLITGYFGDLTKQAVIRFQEKYADEILTPVGETKGTGFVGAATRKKMNEIGE